MVWPDRAPVVVAAHSDLEQASSGTNPGSAYQRVSIRHRKGNVHVGSEPGLLILLGMNFSGIAVTRSAPTCVNVARTARIIRTRYPLRLRYRNLHKNSMNSSFPAFTPGSVILLR